MVKKRYIPAAIVAVLGIVVSFALFQGVRIIEHTSDEKAFRRSASEQITAVEKSITAELVALKSIVGFYQGSSYVDRSEFKSFLNAFVVEGKAFQALGWVPQIAHEQRLEYEAKAREDGLAEFYIREHDDNGKMVPALQREKYYPVYYVEPRVGNEEALGFDLGSNLIRLAALEKARDTNTIVASAPVKLVQLKKDNTGVLIFAPIYKTGVVLETVAQRREHIKGFALGVIRVSGLVTGGQSLRETKDLHSAQDLDIYVYDTGVPEYEQLLYILDSQNRQPTESAPRLSMKDAHAGFHVDYEVNIGGRKWELVARPRDPDTVTGMTFSAFLTLTLALSVTAVLSIHIVLIARRAEHVEDLVALRTQELSEASQNAQDREERIRAVLETAADGIITIDTSGIVETFNREAEHIFGRSAANVIGQNVKCLMPEPFRSDHDGYLSRYKQRGHSDAVNINRELNGLRSDGTIFPIELTISEMHVGGKIMFTGVVRDITERKENDRIKREFISTVSHELRTPLTSIKGALGLLMAGVSGDLPKRMQEMLNIAHNNCDRLVRLINDILDIEKIAAGKMEFRMETLDLVEVLRQALDANKAYGENLNISMKLDSCPDEALILGDHDRLQQVMANLLSNAAKFSPSGGEVLIRCIRTGGGANSGYRVEVIDHGSGIPDEFRDQLFKRFAQVDTSDIRQKGGTGLGLSICRAIIDYHKGEIDFISKAGEGSTFFFEVPQWTSAQMKDQYVSETPTSPLRRILVCEDEPDIAAFMQLLLERENYAVDIAYDAQDARDHLAKHEYAAMTVDIALPGEDGLSLIRSLRDHKETRDLPIIVVSAHADDGQRQLNGYGFGVLDWLEKPIDQNRLRENLRRAISLSNNDKPRILHIEDDPDVARIVSRLAEDVGNVTSAGSLKEAMKHLEQDHFDLVILDLMLPDGDGESIMPMLNRKDGSMIPVIVFSAKDAHHSPSANIHAALVKSNTSNEDLLNIIRSTIDQAEEYEAQGYGGA
ncbi:MAG: CHASE domain-containing protein [Magnetovibrio sp.]|nr:CHASE domain-containing protein [Magnetovibrio sp.]